MTEQEIVARAEILDTLTRYCHAQDQRCWSFYDDVFADDAHIDIPDAVSPGQSAKDHRKWLLDLNARRISAQHMIGNIIFDIKGAEARTVSEVAFVFLQQTDYPDQVRRVRGNALYTDRLVCLTGGWRIRHRVIALKGVEAAELSYDPDILNHIRATAKLAWDAL